MDSPLSFIDQLDCLHLVCLVHNDLICIMHLVYHNETVQAASATPALYRSKFDYAMNYIEAKLLRLNSYMQVALVVYSLIGNEGIIELLPKRKEVNKVGHFCNMQHNTAFCLVYIICNDNIQCVGRSERTTLFLLCCIESNTQLYINIWVTL